MKNLAQHITESFMNEAAEEMATINILSDWDDDEEIELTQKAYALPVADAKRIAAKYKLEADDSVTIKNAKALEAELKAYALGVFKNVETTNDTHSKYSKAIDKMNITTEYVAVVNESLNENADVLTPTSSDKHAIIEFVKLVNTISAVTAQANVAVNTSIFEIKGKVISDIAQGILNAPRASYALTDFTSDTSRKFKHGFRITAQGDEIAYEGTDLHKAFDAYKAAVLGSIKEIGLKTLRKSFKLDNTGSAFL